MTTIFAIFLGWLRLRTGSVWPGSVAHAANNGIEDNLNRLTFTGHLSGRVPTGAGFASILAEAFVLLGIVAAGRARRSPATTSSAAEHRQSERRIRIRPGTTTTMAPESPSKS